MTVKISALVGNEPKPFGYGDTFARERVAGRERLRIGVDREQPQCVMGLIGVLSGPFQLLYVLHTSRTGAPLARYESGVLPKDAVVGFLHTFGRFLSEDARHDLWVRSHGDDATLVLDRHNMIYAYGPLVEFERALRQVAIRAGIPPNVPDPHVHHYYEEWDKSERHLLASLRWKQSPLRPGDVQWTRGAGAV